LLDQRQEGYRLLMYTEWRRRYEDPSSGLDQLLDPAMASLRTLGTEGNLDQLIESLEDIASELDNALSRLSSNEITNDTASRKMMKPLPLPAPNDRIGADCTLVSFADPAAPNGGTARSAPETGSITQRGISAVD
jgi:hypothetical protein